MIKVGDTLPSIKLKTVTSTGVNDFNIESLAGQGKVAIFAVPGAFTPTCSNDHLPGVLKATSDLKSKGIDHIYCLSVNDPFVMQAWRSALNAEGDVTFLADWNGDFTKAIGLDIDVSAAGLGIRSKRYAMMVDKGVVKNLNIEENPGQCSTSSAQSLLTQI